MPGFNKPIKNSKLLKYICILICVAFAMHIMLTGCSKTGTNKDVANSDNIQELSSSSDKM